MKFEKGILRMDNQSFPSPLNQDSILARHSSFPRITVLNLSKNGFDSLNPSSSLFASESIYTIDLTQNKLSVENICAIEEKLHQIREQNRTPAAVSLYPQHLRYSSDLCTFLTSRNFSANDSLGQRMISCGEFENRYYASGACAIITSYQEDWTKFKNNRYTPFIPSNYELQGSYSESPARRLVKVGIFMLVGVAIVAAAAYMLFLTRKKAIPFNISYNNMK